MDAATTGKNTIIFTIGRMNPPTPGHMELIKVMLEANLDLPAGDLGHGRVYIIMSHSKDNVKDPLICDRKRDLLQTKGLIRQMQRTHPALATISVTILCTKDANEYAAECGDRFIISQLCRMIKIETALGHPPTNMEIILGSDRQGAFDKMINPYLSSQRIFFNELGPDGKRLFQTYDLKLFRTEPENKESEKALIQHYIENVDTPIPMEDMSGSLMRALVEYGQKDRFIKLYEPLGLSTEDASELFEELTYELAPKPVQTKKRKVNGGYKKKRRTQKHKRKSKSKRTSKRTYKKRSNFTKKNRK
jgi:hypothetical protein